MGELTIAEANRIFAGHLLELPVVDLSGKVILGRLTDVEGLCRLIEHYVHATPFGDSWCGHFLIPSVAEEDVGEVHLGLERGSRRLRVKEQLEPLNFPARITDRHRHIIRLVTTGGCSDGRRRPSFEPRRSPASRSSSVSLPSRRSGSRLSMPTSRAPAALYGGGDARAGFMGVLASLRALAALGYGCDHGAQERVHRVRRPKHRCDVRVEDHGHCAGLKPARKAVRSGLPVIEPVFRPHLSPVLAHGPAACPSHSPPAPASWPSW